jgi:hypothetical protein
VPPQTTVRIADRGYWIDVELIYDEETDTYACTGLAVRRGIEVDPAASDPATGRVDWLEGGAFDEVVPRDVARLPLAAYIRTAKAFAADQAMPRSEVERVILPRGRPTRGAARQFYADLVRYHDQLLADGDPRPVRTIARLKRVNEKLVHQWLFRGRHPREETTWPKIRRVRGSKDGMRSDPHDKDGGKR